MVWSWFFGKKAADLVSGQDKPQESKKDEQKEQLEDYLTSPLWKIPIFEFIDDNCIVFDDEDENKFEYTSIHNNFKQLIESMIDQLLLDIGISYDQLYTMIKHGLASKNNRKIFEQLLIVDNFLVFKKLMVKRNKELEVEALRELQKSENQVSQDEVDRQQLESEQQEIEFAIQMSLVATSEEQSLIELEQQQLNEAMKQSEQAFQDQQKQQKSPEKITQQKLPNISGLKIQDPLPKLEEQKSDLPSLQRPLTNQSLNPMVQKKYEDKEVQDLQKDKEQVAVKISTMKKEEVQEETMEERKKRLFEQRETLRKKKQKQREDELKQFQELSKTGEQDKIEAEKQKLDKQDTIPLQGQLTAEERQKRANLFSKIKADLKN